MTFEEARAQFPVLEQIAYLNAGTFGPICPRHARGDQRGARAGLSRRPQRGPNFARVMELRESAA